MPLFPLKKIAALAANRQTYLRGVSTYSSGCVHALSCRNDGEHAEHLAARVQDRTALADYAVAVDFNAAGDVVQTRCDCGAPGVCRHIVAALTYKYYQDMVGGMPALASEDSRHAAVTRRMLDRYFHEAATALRAAAPATAAHLYPTLHMEAGVYLTLAVGLPGSHPYVIKDAALFRGRMQQGETAAYGAQLQLVHHPEAFDPASRPLLALIANASLTGARSRRDIPLAPAELDRFFALYEGQSVPVGGQCAVFRAGDPPLALRVEQAQDTLLLTAPCPFFACGEERLYLLTDGTLYASSAAFALALRGLLAALRETDGCLSLSSRQLAAFCSSVLPTVEPFVTFTGETAAFDTFRPLPLSAAVYIDRPEGGQLTARLTYRYGERLYDLPAGETAADDGVIRDVLGEMRAQLAVTRAFPLQTEKPGVFGRDASDESLYTLLTEDLPVLSDALAVYMSDAFRQTRIAAPPRWSAGVRLSSGLLDLQLDLGDLSREDLVGLLESYRRKRRFYRLKSGAFWSLDDPVLQGLARLSDGLGISDRELAEGHLSVPAFRAPFVDRVLADVPQLTVSRDEAFRALRDAIGRVEEREFTPPATLNGTLRDYQRTGFGWLRTMETYGFGAILADDMGLGKTIQILALFLDAQARGITLPSLVVCPASVVLGWESELHRFAPSLRVQTVLGDSDTRRAIIRRIAPGDIVLTSYDLLKRDVALYQKLSFHYHVLDEAQYIKNHTTQNARAVKSIASVQRFALTGTPVENRLSELWSIFDFLMPGFLFSYPRFRDRFELPAARDGDPQALAALSRLCEPFILRRLKRDVLRELPPKTETVLRIPLEEEQRRTYLAAALKMREELTDGGGENRTRLQALTMLTRLRQICCDPSLCFENYTGGSAKRESALELIREAVAAGHRVLLFSQFTSMLALLEEDLTRENLPFFILQGSTPKEKRAAMVRAFNAPDGVPVFLISLRAGGTGLNLTAADVVIHFDPWWNLSVQNQATDRAHRIGQQRPVQVYKLIAQDTVEDKILQLQNRKQSLADAVVHNDSLSLSSLSDEELLSLLLP